MTGVSKSAVGRRIQLAEAMELLPELKDYKTEDDAWKEYKRLEEDVVRTHLHQRVLPHIKEAMDRAGEHFIIGDALAGMRQLADSTFGFAEVDTPYGVDLDRRKSRNQDDHLMGDYNEWSEGEYPKLFATTAQEVYRLLKDNSFAVFWYGMSWHGSVLTTLREVGFGVPDIPAVWIKGDSGQTASPNTTLGSCYEPFFLARKGSPVLAKPGRSNVFNFPKLIGTTKDHPTQKPLVLMKMILETCLFPGSYIIVPFLGSGVTLRAAYKLGHTGMGWDLSQQYKNAFLKRIIDDQKEDDDDGEGEGEDDGD
jgi:site-specific DNA-methyltransferase (adenine-specific)